MTTIEYFGNQAIIADDMSLKKNLSEGLQQLFC